MSTVAIFVLIKGFFTYKNMLCSGVRGGGGGLGDSNAPPPHNSKQLNKQFIKTSHLT